jgi:coenzyme F420-reducing hydrogenase gamma subunit
MQVLRVLSRALLGATPDLPGASVCLECKRKGNVCVMVARQMPCMGPVTRAGCGAICPSMGRDCYACFGPTHDPNVEALASRFSALGLRRRNVARRFRGITGNEPAFRRMADRLESRDE